MVGSTSLLWKSKKQGCITTSTHCSEFIALKIAVVEAVLMRYILHCFGLPVPVDKPTKMFDDNKGVADSVNIPQSELKKKHIAISYHFVKEAIAAKIIDIHWVKSYEKILMF